MKTETMATEASMAGKFFARTYEPDEVIIGKVSQARELPITYARGVTLPNIESLCFLGLSCDSL
jgi:hypothetical protein